MSLLDVIYQVKLNITDDSNNYVDLLPKQVLDNSKNTTARQRHIFLRCYPFHTGPIFGVTMATIFAIIIYEKMSEKAIFL